MHVIITQDRLKHGFDMIAGQREFSWSGLLRLLLCVMCLVKSQATASSGELVEQYLSEADTMYWMSSSANGSMPLLERGFDALDAAERSLEELEVENQDSFRVKIDNLRIELIEQREMAHDTIGGVLPLIRQFLLRDGLSEWLDDPSVIAAVRGAQAITSTLESNWLTIPQFDVVFSSLVSGEGVDKEPNTALENEVAYVFDQNSRYFNRNRMELAAALSPEEYTNYRISGLDSKMASKLCAVWGLERILEVRLRELYVEENTFFYLVSAQVYSKKGNSEGLVSAFGMAINQGSKAWAFILIFVAPLFVAWGLCAFRRDQALRGFVASLVGASATLLLAKYFEPTHPPLDALLVSGLWGPFVAGSMLLLGVPALGFIATRRIPFVSDWLFASNRSARAAAVGYSAGICSVIGYAALCYYPIAYAAFYTAICVPALSFGPLIAVRTFRGSVLKRDEIVSSVLVNTFIFGFILFLLPPADRPLVVTILGTGAILVGILSCLASLRSPFALLPLALILTGTAFCLSMTGQSGWVLPYSLLAVYYILRATKLRPTLLQVDNEVKEAGEEAVSLAPETILTAPDRLWPFVEVPAYQQIVKTLSDAGETQKVGKRSVVMISGEAGCGKTRMLKQALVDRNAEVFHGRCREGDPLGFVVDAFEGVGDLLLQSGESNALATASALSSSMLSMVPGVGMVADCLGADCDGGQPGQIAATILGYLQDSSSSTHEPVWLWIDDAEHLSGDACLVLRELFSNAAARDLPLVVILSGRQIRSEDFLASNSSDGDFCHRFYLELEWGREETRDCLNLVLSDEASTELIGLAGGGGLALSTYLNWVRGLWLEGLLVERNERLELVGSADFTKHVPRDAYEGALNIYKAFSSAHFEVLQAAACDGRRFHLGILAEALELPYRSVLEALEEAERVGVVFDHPDDDVFEFSNNIFHEALVHEMKLGEGYRQRYYATQRTLALAYSRSSEPSHLLEAAHHAVFAGKRFEVEACKIVDPAMDLSERSGEWQQAANYAEFILERQSMVSDETFCRAGAVDLRAHWTIGSFLNKKIEPALENCFKELTDFAEEKSSESMSDALLLLCCEICRVLVQRRGEHYLALALKTVPRKKYLSEAQLHSFIGKRCLHMAGLIAYTESRHSDLKRLQQARDILEAALSLPMDENGSANGDQAEILTTYANVLNALAKASNDQSLLSPSRDVLKQSIELKKASGDQLGLAISYGTLGRSYLYAPEPSEEDLKQAIQAFQKDLELSVELGDVTGQIIMPSNLGECYLRLGLAEEALAQYQTSLGVAQRVGQKLSQAFALAGILESQLASAKKNDKIEVYLSELGALLEEISENERTVFVGKLHKMLECVKSHHYLVKSDHYATLTQYCQ